MSHLDLTIINSCRTGQGNINEGGVSDGYNDRCIHVFIATTTSNLDVPEFHLPSERIKAYKEIAKCSGTL